MLQKKRYTCNCDPEHPFDEHFEFIRKYQRQTVAYEKHVFMLAHKNTVKNVSEIAGISEGRCQRIYNHYAQHVLQTRQPESLRLLGIDDIARKKGHNYNTGIRFHIAQQLNKCVDDARKHIQNHIKKHGKKDEIFKVRWAMLKNVEDLKRDETLNLILACTKYPKIEQLHYLKEEFREFFLLETKEDAIAFIEYYKELVAEYDIPGLKVFCKTLDNWLPYILNYYDFSISNGLTEGNSHKVKNIKRRAYGYRNPHHFDLRVKLEFECA